jgi:hypothetical protein
MFSPVNKVVIDNDDITVVTWNVSLGSTSSFSMAFSLVDQALQTRYGSRNRNALPFSPPILIAAPAQTSNRADTVITIASNKAIADLGPTQIFVMDCTPVHNKRQTTCPLKVALANGHRLMSTHMCDIIIPGLPTTLIGHIIPELSIASLFGICVLTEAGCTVKFDNKEWEVRYNGKIILISMKDPTMDLWTLPIVGPAGKTSLNNTHEEQDPFVNLREDFLKATSKASSSKESTLAIPVCASTQACKAGGKAMKSLKKNSTERTGIVHPHHPNQGQQHQVCPSIPVQPSHLHTPKSNPTRFPQRVPQPHCQRSDGIPQPKPRQCKGPHEVAPSRNPKHHTVATTSAPVQMTASKCASCPHQQ